MVPARKASKSAKLARASHHALKPLNLSACPKCGTARMPHRACGNCGYLNSKISLKVKSEEA